MRSHVPVESTLEGARDGAASDVADFAAGTRVALFTAGASQVGSWASCAVAGGDVQRHDPVAPRRYGGQLS
jgi:hypothetical protein